MILEHDVNAGIISTFADQISVPGRDTDKDTPQEPCGHSLSRGWEEGGRGKGEKITTLT